MNITTNAMQKLTNMLVNTDKKLEEMGTEPYGIRKLTAKEERERFKNLTPGELWNMIQTYGKPAVNEWLQKMEEKHG